MLIAERGRLMQQLPEIGKMVVVQAPENEIRRVIQSFSESVSIAAINAPNQMVISGEATSIKKIVLCLDKRNIRTTSLPVSHAFHSPLMKTDFRKIFRDSSKIKFQFSQNSNHCKPFR